MDEQYDGLMTEFENIPKGKVYEIGDAQARSDIDDLKSDVQDLQDTKVDKETGKGLSTNDYTTAEKIKLSGIEENSEVDNVWVCVVDEVHPSVGSNSIIDIYSHTVGRRLRRSLAPRFNEGDMVRVYFNGVDVEGAIITDLSVFRLIINEVYESGEEPYDPYSLQVGRRYFDLYSQRDFTFIQEGNSLQLKMVYTQASEEMRGEVMLSSDTNSSSDVVAATSKAVKLVKDMIPQDASEVPYDGTNSGLSATDVQSAIDEIDPEIYIENKEFWQSILEVQEYSGLSYYSAGDIVRYQDRLYVSKQDNNRGAVPSSSPTWWDGISLEDFVTYQEVDKKIVDGMANKIDKQDGVGYGSLKVTCPSGTVTSPAIIGTTLDHANDVSIGAGTISSGNSFGNYSIWLESNRNVNPNTVGLYAKSYSGNKVTLCEMVNEGQGDVLSGELVYSAGSNIQIANGVISATDTVYSAGENIEISNTNEIKAVINKIMGYTLYEKGDEFSGWRFNGLGGILTNTQKDLYVYVPAPFCPSIPNTYDLTLRMSVRHSDGGYPFIYGTNVSINGTPNQVTNGTNMSGLELVEFQDLSRSGFTLHLRFYNALQKVQNVTNNPITNNTPIGVFLVMSGSFST